MRIHLINPSDLSFGIGVITPRWLYVLAQATPTRFGEPVITDETLEPLDPSTIARGDIVGIGIHTGNALRGYQIGHQAREAGAFVVFGGVHATCIQRKRMSSAARTRSSKVTAISSGRRCSTTAWPDEASWSTRAVGSSQNICCRRAGI